VKKTVLFLIIALSLYSVTISGVGIADTKKEAKKEALGDLSSNISAKVKSKFISQKEVFGKSIVVNRKNFISIGSNLPIKGVKFNTLEGARLTQVNALLSDENSLKLYKEELKRIKINITTLYQNLQKEKNKDIQYNILQSLLNLIESFNKHKIVAMILKGKNLPSLDITQEEIKLKLQKLQKDIKTLNIAAKVLSRGITKKNIYIYPIKPKNSNDITKLSRVLKKLLSANLNTKATPKEANYFLRGDYEILKNSIFVTINVQDINNNILKTNIVNIKKEAYKNIPYKPKTKTFDEALNSEIILSGDLRVKIGFKGFYQADGIDLNKGDKIDIVAKTNKAICYYLVGYVIRNREKFSYLLPIGSGDSPFINYVTGEDVNRYVTLFKDVEITEPLGRETLQIIASTLKKSKCPLIVPKCKIKKDFCIIGNNITSSLHKTRALSLKKSKNKVEKAEYFIHYRSFEKWVVS